MLVECPEHFVSKQPHAISFRFRTANCFWGLFLILIKVYPKTNYSYYSPLNLCNYKRLAVLNSKNFLKCRWVNKIFKLLYWSSKIWISFLSTRYFRCFIVCYHASHYYCKRICYSLYLLVIVIVIIINHNVYDKFNPSCFISERFIIF